MADLDNDTEDGKEQRSDEAATIKIQMSPQDRRMTELLNSGTQFGPGLKYYSKKTAANTDDNVSVSSAKRSSVRGDREEKTLEIKYKIFKNLQGYITDEMTDKGLIAQNDAILTNMKSEVLQVLKNCSVSEQGNSCTFDHSLYVNM